MSDDSTTKKCAVCGEIVEHSLLQCPACGKGTFESKKLHWHHNKPKEKSSEESNNLDSDTNVTFLSRLAMFFSNLFGAREIAVDQRSSMKMSSNKPAATTCYIFGSVFTPQRDQFVTAFNILFRVHEKILKKEYFDAYFPNVPIEPLDLNMPERSEFLEKSELIVKGMHPDAYILNAMMLDQKTGKDMIIYAVWDGDMAIIAKNHFESTR